MMRKMNPEEIGLEMETVMGLLQLYGDERALKELARRMGEERAMKEIAQTIGKERWHQITEQLFPKESDNNDD